MLRILCVNSHSFWNWSCKVAAFGIWLFIDLFDTADCLFLKSGLSWRCKSDCSRNLRSSTIHEVNIFRHQFSDIHLFPPHISGKVTLLPPWNLKLLLACCLLLCLLYKRALLQLHWLVNQSLTRISCLRCWLLHDVGLTASLAAQSLHWLGFVSFECSKNSWFGIVWLADQCFLGGWSRVLGIWFLFVSERIW